ncbi:MAG TPA: hypothetical protein VGN93_26550 [Shinella sp.]|nr:hypothetical protein [Shinella sp.]
MKQHIIDTGKSDLRDPKAFGGVYYNSGLVNALISVEIVRQAQAKFSNGPITGEEGQWALAQLNALHSMDMAARAVRAILSVMPLDTPLQSSAGHPRGRRLLDRTGLILRPNTFDPRRIKVRRRRRLFRGSRR